MRVLLLKLILVGVASAQVVVIEPDDFADGTILDNISPVVTLSTGAFDDNQPTFSVTAETLTNAQTTTGDKVFAHAGVSFFSDVRTFRMDFNEPVSAISIDYIASGFSGEAFAGLLQAFDANGTLIVEDTTAPLFDEQFETLTVSVPSGNIAYALAYPPEDPFGRLDNLRLTVVPEPSSAILLTMALLVVGFRLRRR